MSKVSEYLSLATMVAGVSLYAYACSLPFTDQRRELDSSASTTVTSDVWLCNAAAPDVHNNPSASVYSAGFQRTSSKDVSNLLDHKNE